MSLTFNRSNLPWWLEWVDPSPQILPPLPRPGTGTPGAVPNVGVEAGRAPVVSSKIGDRSVSHNFGVPGALEYLRRTMPATPVVAPAATPVEPAPTVAEPAKEAPKETPKETPKAEPAKAEPAKAEPAKDTPGTPGKGSPGAPRDNKGRPDFAGMPEWMRRLTPEQRARIPLATGRERDPRTGRPSPLAGRRPGGIRDAGSPNLPPFMKNVGGIFEFLTRAQRGQLSPSDAISIFSSFDPRIGEFTRRILPMIQSGRVDPNAVIDIFSKFDPRIGEMARRFIPGLTPGAPSTPTAPDEWPKTGERSPPGDYPGAGEPRKGWEQPLDTDTPTPPATTAPTPGVTSGDDIPVSPTEEPATGVAPGGAPGGGATSGSDVPAAVPVAPEAGQPTAAPVAPVTSEPGPAVSPAPLPTPGDIPPGTPAISLDGGATNISGAGPAAAPPTSAPVPVAPGGALGPIRRHETAIPEERSRTAALPGNDAGVPISRPRPNFGADMRTNDHRPRHYTGKLTINGQQFDWGTGGGSTPSIPYGRYYIHPGAVGPLGRRIGAIAGVSDSDSPGNNTLTDPTYLGGRRTHAREGIEIHPSTSLMTNGCVGVSRAQFPAFQREFQRLAAKGPMELVVKPDGTATISSINPTPAVAGR